VTRNACSIRGHGLLEIDGILDGLGVSFGMAWHD
jgi:hypothetical protein